jgi:hypothetical protein
MSFVEGSDSGILRYRHSMVILRYTYIDTTIACTHTSITCIHENITHKYFMRTIVYTNKMADAQNTSFSYLADVFRTMYRNQTYVLKGFLSDE